MFGNRFI